MRSANRPRAASVQVATALGWFSVGIGLAQLLAPRAIARGAGMPDAGMAVRACGARELASGVGILRSDNPTPWLWSRVAGDAVDLGLLGVAARRSGGTPRLRAGIAAAVVAGMTVLDVMAASRQRQRSDAAAIGIDIDQSIIVNRLPAECYRFWRDFSRLPRFMSHLESVTPIDDRHTHWKAIGPGGMRIEWDAELTVDQPDRLLAWRSLEDADIDSAGTVSFDRAPGDRGTIVRVEMQYKPPAGRPGAVLAGLLGDAPEQALDDALRRFKSLLETGVIPTTDGQSTGPRSLVGRLFSTWGAQP